MKTNTKIPFAPTDPGPEGATHAVPTGEFRPPQKGEWYASGAIVEAYQTRNNMTTSYWIVKPVIKGGKR